MDGCLWMMLDDASSGYLILSRQLSLTCKLNHVHKNSILYLNGSNAPLCTPQRGWYGMDWRRGHWMTFYL